MLEAHLGKRRVDSSPELGVNPSAQGGRTGQDLWGHLAHTEIGEGQGTEGV